MQTTAGLLRDYEESEGFSLVPRVYADPRLSGTSVSMPLFRTLDHFTYVDLIDEIFSAIAEEMRRRCGGSPCQKRVRVGSVMGGLQALVW